MNIKRRATSDHFLVTHERHGTATMSPGATSDTESGTKGQLRSDTYALLQRSPPHSVDCGDLSRPPGGLKCPALRAFRRTSQSRIFSAALQPHATDNPPA